MYRLNELAVTTMYIFIFLVTIIEKNPTSSVIILILALIYIKQNNKLKIFDKKLKKNLFLQKERFINILSHDLRIPIIAQIRALEIINNKNLGGLNDAQSNMLFEVENSCRCVLNLMSLMINTYKMENNSYKLIYEKFNLTELILSCFDELLPEAQEKNITFEYRNDNKNLNITADKTELKKVILNILSTSISNAGIGQRISVITDNFNNKIRLIIAGSNNQLYSNLNSDYSSIGLGIRFGFCKKIIENHKGRFIQNNINNSLGFEIPQYA